MFVKVRIDLNCRSAFVESDLSKGMTCKQKLSFGCTLRPNKTHQRQIGDCVPFLSLDSLSLFRPLRLFRPLNEILIDG